MIDGADPMAYLVSPDAWIKIPEFGVMPSEVNYEGFSFPVIHATVNPFSVNLMKLIGIARKLASREFKTLAELRQVYEGALDVMIEEVEEGSAEWTSRQSLSMIYMEFMRYIQEARAPVLKHQSNLEALSNAALLIAWCGTHGAKAAAKLLSKKNAGNASMPRPNARAVDHDDVLNEHRHLVREGHTEGEARGILLQRGNMGSQATIYRVTKKSSH